MSPRQGVPTQLALEVENGEDEPLVVFPSEVRLVAQGAPDDSAVPLALQPRESAAGGIGNTACLGAGGACATCAGLGGALALAAGAPGLGVPLACGGGLTLLGLFGVDWSQPGQAPPAPLVVEPDQRATLLLDASDPRVGTEAVELLLRPQPSTASGALRLPVGAADAPHLGFSAPQAPPFVLGARFSYGTFAPLGERTRPAAIAELGIVAGLQHERLGATIEAATGSGWMLGGAVRWTAQRGPQGAIVPWIGYGRVATGSDVGSDDGLLHGQGPRLGVDLLALLDRHEAFGWSLGVSGLGLTAEVAPLVLDRSPQPLLPSRVWALQASLGVTAALF